MLTNLRIAIVGAGTMGEAVIGGLLRAELIAPEQIVAATPREERRLELAERWGIHTTADNREATEWGDILLLAIKPQMVEHVVPPLRGALSPGNLVISVIAGTKIERLSTMLSHDAVVRSMPNTPAKIAEGMTVWTASPAVDEIRKGWTRTVLGALGRELEVEEEKLIDMATALSGTGPAYIFLVMEALIDAGVHMGFPRRIAEILVEQTVLGSVRYAMKSGRHVTELRNMVTSPGGTTAAALYEMERGGLRTVMADGVWAAYRRAQELGER
ncbi:MAG: pyrroline-5-carboxylate reductase [Herpetosiphonaceae bacterium]|nr:MAG: pyrroline-5-carboxylate reductase [Herpetosiphonaceae bacterium]